MAPMKKTGMAAEDNHQEGTCHARRASQLGVGASTGRLGGGRGTSVGAVNGKEVKTSKMRESREGRGETPQSPTPREQRQASLAGVEGWTEADGEAGGGAGGRRSAQVPGEEGLRIRAVGRGASRHTRHQAGQTGRCDPHCKGTAPPLPLPQAPQPASGLGSGAPGRTGLWVGPRAQT